jgi:hypothetical protein
MEGRAPLLPHGMAVTQDDSGLLHQWPKRDLGKPAGSVQRRQEWARLRRRTAAALLHAPATSETPSIP